MVKKCSKLVFWGIIILGIVLPSVVMLTVGTIFNRASLLDFLRPPFPELLVEQAIVGLLNAIPFIALALLVLVKVILEGDIKIHFYRRIGGIIGAAITTFSISLFSNIAYYIDLFGPSSSSTGGLVFIFIPIYGLILMPVGYWGGQLVGFSLERKKQNMSEEKFKKELIIYISLTAAIFLLLLFGLILVETTPLYQ